MITKVITKTLSFTAATVLLSSMAATHAATVLPANVVPEATFNWSVGADNIVNTPDDRKSAWGQVELTGSPTVAVTGTFPQSGNGSLELKSSGTTSKGGLAYYPPGTGFGPLSGLTAVSYDWLRSATSAGQPDAAPLLRLFLSTGAYDGTNHVATLVYLPGSNGATGLGNSNTAWHSTNVMAGPQVWQSRSAGPGGQQTKSFADFATDPDYADLIVFAVEAGFGSGYSAEFVGAIDNVNVTSSAASVAANFEASAPQAAGPVSVPTLGLTGLLGLSAVVAGIGALRRRRTG